MVDSALFGTIGTCHRGFILSKLHKLSSQKVKLSFHPFKYLIPVKEKYWEPFGIIQHSAALLTIVCCLSSALFVFGDSRML